jgi:hypothetical protein
MLCLDKRLPSRELEVSLAGMSRKNDGATATAPDAARAARLNRLAVLLATGGLLLLMLAIAVFSNASADTWWHLATGRWILDHFQVPHTDVFSFSAAGKPWITHEYGAEVLMYLVFNAGGWPALALATAAVLMIGWWLVYRRCSGPALVNGAALLFGMWVAQPGMLLRPQTFSFLGGALFLWILDRYYWDRDPRVLIGLPVTMLVWVQLHGGFVLGLAIAGAALAGAVADRWLFGERKDVLKWKEIRPLAGALAASVVVVPLNPNGLKLYELPFYIMRMRITPHITEWMPPLWSETRFQPFFALLALTLVTMIVARKRYRMGQWLLFFGFAYAALHARRNIAVFPLVAVPLLAQGIRFPKALSDVGMKIKPAIRVALALLLLALGARLAGKQTSREVAFQQYTAHFGWPVAAAKYVVDHNLPPNLFNSYNYGGFLIWQLPPEYKVFIDGRADLYGDDFIENYQVVWGGQVNPDPTLNAYKIRTVLTEPDSGLARVLEEESKAGLWRKVYSDRLAVIFTR